MHILISGELEEWENPIVSHLRISVIIHISSFPNFNRFIIRFWLSVALTPPVDRLASCSLPTRLIQLERSNGIWPVNAPIFYLLKSIETLV